MVKNKVDYGVLDSNSQWQITQKGCALVMKFNERLVPVLQVISSDGRLIIVSSICVRPFATRFLSAICSINIHAVIVSIRHESHFFPFTCIARRSILYCPRILSPASVNSRMSLLPVSNSRSPLLPRKRKNTGMDLAAYPARNRTKSTSSVSSFTERKSKLYSSCASLAVIYACMYVHV